MEKDLKTLCMDAIVLIKETGAFIKNERALNNLSVESKGKNDFVTHVDKGSEERLVKGLKKLLPECGFIAEESTSTEKGDRYNWIIDPIDGTTNFIHGLSPYAISVALMDNTEVVIGIVYELGLGECFYSYKGGAAFLDGQEIHVSNRKSISDSLIATGFPYTQYQRIDSFMKTLDYFMRKSHGLRRLGSAATDLAYVACGRFDGFYEYNLSPWDVAAGAFIVQQAGGMVSDFSGGSNYIFGKEIISANSHVFDEFLSDVKLFMNEK